MGKIYYNAEEILKADADINIIDGGRNIGKSTDICRRAIQEAIRTHGERGKLAYIRRKENQVRAMDVEAYIKEPMLRLWTNNEWECIKVKRGWGYLAKCDGFDAKGNPIWKLSEFPVIKGFALFKANDYKSQNYPVDWAIYEEYQTNDGYLTDEPEKVMSIFSTLKRENEHFKMFMVANTVCRINPYVSEWGLTNYNRQKKGTIDLYKLYLSIFDDDGNEKFYKIAREYSELAEDGLKDETVLAKIKEHSRRKRLSAMITRGDWEETHKYLTISYKEVEKLQPLYIIYITSQNACFKITWYKDLEHRMIFPYVVPHKQYFENIKNPRIISNDQYFVSPLFTMGLQPLTDIEKKLFAMLKHHSRFCNNLTGNEFFAMLKNF